MTTSSDDIHFTIDGATPSRQRPGPRPRRAGRRIPLRWCALAAGLALLAAVTAGIGYHQRGRPVISTRVLPASPGQATADLTGCPVGGQCSYGSIPADEFPTTLARLFPAMTPTPMTVVYDAAGATDYRRSLAFSTPSGIHVTIESDYRPDAPAVSAHVSTPIPQQGPADLVLVQPGSRAGDSVAVLAHVPAGVPVPIAELRLLVADPDLQLAD
ncbi:MAG: hypothetical protein ACR2N4_08820 [Jatrophihabitans sp.]